MVPAEVTPFVGKKFVLLPTVGGSSNYKFYMMWPDSQKFAKETQNDTACEDNVFLFGHRGF